jgi:pimeloyl-ACP methyl ester carboxylesterase
MDHLVTTTPTDHVDVDAPLWRAVDLPERGATYACDLPGPTPTAPAVILLHGLGATGALNWDPFLELLNERFRVVALDHRGHGRGLVGDSFTLEHCADDAVALLDALGIDRAIFVGYSMGGPIAQLSWLRHPTRVRGLVLCATAADFGGTPLRRAAASALVQLERMVTIVPRTVRRRATRSLIVGLVPDPSLTVDVADAFDWHDEEALRGAVHAILRFSSTGWLGDVAVPAAVVVTERDRVVPPPWQRRLADLIPDADTIAIEANHRACRSEPEAFGLALLDACALVAKRSADRPPASTPRTRRWTRWRRRIRDRRAGRRNG